MMKRALAWAPPRVRMGGRVLVRRLHRRQLMGREGRLVGGEEPWPSGGLPAGRTGPSPIRGLGPRVAGSHPRAP